MLTVGEVIEKLRAASDDAWQESKIDGILSGDEKTEAKGVAVVWSPSISAIRFPTTT